MKKLLLITLLIIPFIGLAQDKKFEGKKKEPVIEAIQFDGKNFDDLKAFCPKIEKYKIRKEHAYTVGWSTEKETKVKGAFTEARPGDYIVKEDDEFKILTSEEFKEQYESLK